MLDADALTTTSFDTSVEKPVNSKRPQAVVASVEAPPCRYLFSAIYAWLAFFSLAGW